MSRAKPLITLRQLIFGLLIFVVLLLLLCMSPVFSIAAKESLQNKALQQSKGIFYGLIMYATDHNGKYPDALEENFPTFGAPVTDANHAYANIVPNYVQSEHPFSIAVSAYCQDRRGKPIVLDEDLGPRLKVRSPGGNHFAYVRGLTESSDPAWPIIADGFAGGPGAITNPAYSKDNRAYGGVWQGRNAIVVRRDGSASILPVNQATLAILRAGSSGANLFTPSTDPEDPWLTGCTVLNPSQNH
jgi:hypothetical protein